MPPKSSKPAAAKGKEKQEKRQAIAKDRETLRAKTDELLAKPLSAFALFGFAQRNLLKKQKPGATVKEIVKAIGERWLLLAEAERRKYAALAEEDARHASLGTRPRAQSPAEEAAHAGLELQLDSALDTSGERS